MEFLSFILLIVFLYLVVDSLTDSKPKDSSIKYTRTNTDKDGSVTTINAAFSTMAELEEFLDKADSKNKE